jgi:hypothetical protein
LDRKNFSETGKSRIRASGFCKQNLGLIPRDVHLGNRCFLAAFAKSVSSMSGGFRAIYLSALLAALLALGMCATPSFFMGLSLACLPVLVLCRYRLIRRSFVSAIVLASPFLVAVAVLGAPVVGWVAYSLLVPAYSARFQIPESGTTVGLEFFWANDLWRDGLSEKTRYITVTSPRGTVKYSMDGWDWAHRARTSVYVTNDEKSLAVLGPDHEDVVIDIEQLKVSRAFRITSQDWTYLGAFDFVPSVIRGRDRTFRFIPASEQAECVPTEPNGSKLWAPRNSARKSRCG